MIVLVITVILITTGLMAGLVPLRTELLRREARIVADQVLSFRSWVAGSGMVWVDNLAPGFNDFLVKRYDATSGGSYYGKNPDLATRELSIVAGETPSHVSFRLTSDEYRQEDNRPDDFELRAIQSFKENDTIKYKETFENDRYRFAMPILIKKECLQCHGNPDKAPSAVIEKYGNKRAFGYKIGDVRGIISIKLPIIGFIHVIKTMANPFTIGLIVFAIIFNFLFTYRVITNRLRRLTRNTNAIAEGRLNTEMVYMDPAESNDELDHACHALSQVKQSMRILIKGYTMEK